LLGLKHLNRIFSLTRIVWIFLLTFIWLLITEFSYFQLILGIVIAVSLCSLFQKQTGYKKRWFFRLSHAIYLTVLYTLMDHISLPIKIVTGKINPRIYALKTKIKSSIGVFLITMFITFTPSSSVLKIQPPNIFIYTMDKDNIIQAKRINKILERGFE